MTTDRFDLLSARELEVLGLSADSLKPKLIAQRLSLSERTVYAHLSNAAKKLGSSVGEAAVAMAKREALGPYAKPAQQSLQLAPTVARLLDLFVPEVSGRSYNDLSTRRRLVVIVSRTVMIALTLFAIASLVRDVGRILGQPR